MGNMSDSWGDGDVLYPDCVNVNICIVLRDVTIGGN